MSSEIYCPGCKKPTESKVLSTRHGKFDTLRRRRECKECETRFTTIESSKALDNYRTKFSEVLNA